LPQNKNLAQIIILNPVQNYKELEAKLGLTMTEKKSVYRESAKRYQKSKKKEKAKKGFLLISWDWTRIPALNLLIIRPCLLREKNRDY
jgi:hypothetical protein